MDVDGSAVEVPQAGMEGVEGASAVESAAAAGPGSSGAGAGAGAGDMHVEEDAPAQEQEGDEDEDGEDSGGEGKEPKHRWAVFFGYVGARFQGLQKNPGAYTVEDELEKALFSAGLIVQSNYGNLARVGWNRAARTDKGVHAAAQVVSLRMRVKSGEEAEIITKINSYLPEDLRVHGIFKVTRAFNSKNQCSGRRYGYILPTFVLAPRTSKVDMYVAVAPPMSEAMKARLRQNVAAAASAGPDAFQTGSAYATAQQNMWEARAKASALAAAQAGPVHYTVSAGVPTSSAVFPAVTPSVSSSGVASPVDDYQTGLAFVRATAQRWEAREKHAASRRAGGTGDSYRIPKDALTRLRFVLGQYVGTHAFHNFTPRLKAGDATTIRYISDTSVSEPFTLKVPATAVAVPASSSSGTSNETPAEVEMEFVHITLVGQSFLLNQIRHMVGLAVDIVRGAAPEFALSLAFSAGVVKLPLAPAEGLYLDQCFFLSYDKRFGRDHPRLTGSDLPRPVQQRIKAFKEGYIWAHMAKDIMGTSTATGPFHRYLDDLDKYPISYKYKSLVLRGAPEASGGGAGAGGAGSKRKRNEMSSGADEEGGASSSAAHRLDRDSILAPARHVMSALLTHGGAVSKEAKEKSEFKRAFREEKYKKTEEKHARKQARRGARAAGEDPDAANAGAEAEDPSGGGQVVNSTAAQERAAPAGAVIIRPGAAIGYVPAVASSGGSSAHARGGARDGGFHRGGRGGGGHVHGRGGRGGGRGGRGGQGAASAPASSGQTWRPGGGNK